MLQLEPLPYPVYFVNEYSDRWKDLLESDDLPSDIESLYERCVDGIDIWSAQVYIHLKQRGLNVHFTDRPVPEKICVISYHHLKVKRFAFNSYIVASQYDCARPEICEQRVVLNEIGVRGANDHFMPHWPHPILQPRDRSRGNRIENLIFKGGICNIAKPFLIPTFSESLRALGINFSLSTSDPNQQFRDWGDYRQTDVVLAVRNATEDDLKVKPAVKLINAWAAGCPAILGPEPAYQALRRSELDFIEVRSPEEAIVALQRLKNNPEYYAAMVENGLERAKEFTVDQLALQWRNLLAGSVAQGYEQWLQQSAMQKVVGRPLQFVNRVVKHKQQIKLYTYYRDNGPRLFPETQPVQTPVSVVAPA
jgi:hypothetical protein